MTGKETLGGAIVALTLVVGVIYGIHATKAEAKAEKRGMANSSVCRNVDEEWVKIPAGSYKDRAGDCLAGTPPAPFVPTQRIPGPCERPWTFETREIPEEGLPVYLCQGWKDWPKGGKITIRTPSGEILHDEPGVVNHFGFQPDGMYVFRADPEGSKRQVQLYNRQ